MACVTRESIDIVQLDEELERELTRYGSLKDFRILLWRQEPDATGSNWNARIERSKIDTEHYPPWWDVVPRMRERFNLR